MMSLFSSFDNFFYYNTFLFSLIFSFLVFQSFTKVSQMKMVFSNLNDYFVSFFSSLSSYSTKMIVNSLVSLFFSVFFMNFLSVGPWNFPTTSLVSVVLFLSLLLWTSLFLFSLHNSLKGFIYHLVPESTPLGLVWFIFVIELVSLVIRPITLMVRLVANILAGHLLMILLSGLVLMFPYTCLSYVVLNLVEMVVSLIQAYIFVTMVYLYYSEMC